MFTRKQWNFITSEEGRSAILVGLVEIAWTIYWIINADVINQAGMLFYVLTSLISIYAIKVLVDFYKEDKNGRR